LLRRRLPAHVDAGNTTLTAVYLRWLWWRAALHRGWWLVTSVYLVVDAGLSPSQLVVIGVAQAAVALVCEIPAGVVADTISRKWSLVLSQLLMGSAMLATGLVTDFTALVATQMLWGLSWTFASGAEVAWITDELDDRARISGVLVRAGRAQLTGAAAGIAALGALGSLTERSPVMVAAGAAMLALGLYVVRFPEVRFVPARSARWAAGWSILVGGIALTRASRAILVMFAATLLVNGAWTGAGRMWPRRLVDLGLPSDPVLWFAAVGLLALVVGAVALREVESRVDSPRRSYVVACAAGVVGLVWLAAAPEEVSASAAVVFVSGTAVPLTRTIATIWVNRETTSDVRATVHSFLAQAEYVGEIVLGLAVAGVAVVAGLSAALVTCALLFALTIVGVQGGARAHS
jgi:MFS family permease